MLKQSHENGISPEEAFKVVKHYLEKGIEFIFTINPKYAYNWAVNNNAFMIASALKKYEEAIRAEREREMVDYLKILVSAGMLFFILAMALYVVVMALHNGGGGILPHPNPAPTPAPGVHNPKQISI